MLPYAVYDLGQRHINERPFYYVKDLTGNIRRIVDSNGKCVIKYDYDAWGRVINTEYSDTLYTIWENAYFNAYSIGQLNSLIYKDYYYDKDLELYYLQTRYYDPSTCQFISPDNADYLDPQSINGLNLYAYCGNDPVNRYDLTGHFWDYIFDAAFLIWGVVDVVKNPGDWKNWVSLGVDLVFAVIPFIPSGAGQVIKVGNKIDNAFDVANAMNKLDNIHDFGKITVIGQSMNRVQNAGRTFNALNNLYYGFKSYNKLASMGKLGKLGAEMIGKTQNALWLFGKLRKGYTVLDIGFDMAKIAKGIRSSSYAMEKFIVLLWNARNIWKFLINYFL